MNITEQFSSTQFAYCAPFSADYHPNITWEPHSIFSVVETTCIIWFTIEYVLRLIVSPDRLMFMCGLLNAVDFIAIFPFYMELFLSACGYDVDSLRDIKGELVVLFVL